MANRTKVNLLILALTVSGIFYNRLTDAPPAADWVDAVAGLILFVMARAWFNKNGE